MRSNCYAYNRLTRHESTPCDSFAAISMISRKNFWWRIIMIKYVALSIQVLGFVCSVTEARGTGWRWKRERGGEKREKRGREGEREEERVVSIYRPVIEKHYQLTESDSAGASSAMHRRRLETSLTNRIYIWKVRQLSPFLRATFYFIDIVRVALDCTILRHLSLPSLSTIFDYFHMIALASRFHKFFFRFNFFLPFLFWILARNICVVIRWRFRAIK